MNFENRQITSIKLGQKYAEKLRMLTDLSRGLAPEVLLGRVPGDLLTAAKRVSISELDLKIKSGQGLSVAESLGGMLNVIYATNNYVRGTLAPKLSYEEAIAKGTYFLTLMAAKESFVGLSEFEVAGMVAAAHLDIVYTPNADYVFETSGMGADRGWGSRDTKTINVSTLSALVLAGMGYRSTKHGSYGNTTKVGSTDVPEQFGANIHVSDPDRIQNLLDQTNFWFSDAHSVKTLHFLSHLLMVETVNHVVGPMTAPISRNTKIYKSIGVNHNVHPKIIAKAYSVLHEIGLVDLGGVVVLGGVSSKPRRAQVEDEEWFRQHSYLDEFSPKATIVSYASGKDYLGSTVISDKDFGLRINERDLRVKNTIPNLMKANEQALRGGMFAEYLACNVAIALHANNLTNGISPGVLQSNFDLALSSIEKGETLETLEKYIRISGGRRVLWL